MNITITKPRIVAFEVTRKCQLNCVHCRAAASEEPAKEYLTTEQCKRILLCLAEYNKCVIILTGGEPMEREDIYELIEYGNNIGHRMAVATCGYPINNDSIKKLKASGVLTLSFSLDGSDPTTHDSFRRVTGAFEITLAAIEKARNNDIRFQINTTITRRNIEHIPKIAQLAQKLGAYCFNPFILVPTGRGSGISDEILEPDVYERLLIELMGLKSQNSIDVRITCGPQFRRIMTQKNPEVSSAKNRRKGCMAGGEFAFIGYQGDIQTCGFLDIPAGNLINNDYNFADIWENSAFLNDIRNVLSYQGKCGQCEFVRSCGGCRARAYAMTGNYLASDPICDYQPKSVA
ncbi:MAG: radical SAM/SPASM domain-containing protein [Planctomycetota bacterium]|nr:MAG: radical SAM/SPASM domain-containing protein [Planctomycetota bacterium]